MRTLMLALLSLGLVTATPVLAQDPADLNDLEIAHVAYTADLIDIQYAHLALALSENEEVRTFARTMISDHEAVNAEALALLDQLGAEAQDNFLSQSLLAGSVDVVDKLTSLRGAEFDMAYATNEFAYHQAVNELVANTFIPNIENAEMKALFEQALEIFRMHEEHAEKMVESLQ